MSCLSLKCDGNKEDAIKSLSSYKKIPQILSQRNRNYKVHFWYVCSPNRCYENIQTEHERFINYCIIRYQMQIRLLICIVYLKSYICVLNIYIFLIKSMEVTLVSIIM